MTTKKANFLSFIIVFFLCSCIASLGTGCGSDVASEGTIGGSDASNGDAASAGDGDTDNAGGDSIEDGVPFSSLNWTYGGSPRASGAVLSSPRITNLSCRNGWIYYTWAVGMSGWGLEHSYAGAIACAFVQKADGTWVGGKFDWVSTSRASRNLHHIPQGYNGWTLSGVPNPCQLVYVVVDAKGNRRSNVAGPVTWQR